jgi:predicted phage terminase large subunit-like protein
MFLSTAADVSIYGGAAGGGKTYGLLLEPLRHLANPNFRCVFFRRTYSQITMEGGLWDEAQELYSAIEGTELTQSPPTITLPAGGRIAFRHLQHEKDRLAYQGAQIPLIAFDELTHFSASQFFYLLSRNRSAKAGFKPYIRATTNPDPDSWVKDFISWWIDENTGLPIPERAGKIRYFVRRDDEIVWGSREELLEKYPTSVPKSVSFIPARLEDNRILVENDPSYRSNLEAQDRVTKERLLEGNWLVRRSAGTFFKRDDLPIYSPEQHEIESVCRFWDMASTKPSPSNPDPDYLAGLLLAKLRHEKYRYCILDIERHRVGPGQVEAVMARTAKTDAAIYPDLIIRSEQQPGSAGKDQVHHLASGIFEGYDYEGVRPTGAKEIRATSASSVAQQGKLATRDAPWTEAFIEEAEAFPEGRHDDMVDALSGAYAALAEDTDDKGRRKAFSALNPQKLSY